MNLKERDNEKWESGELGRSAEQALVASAADESALDEALAMQLISIRLPVRLLKTLKAIADVLGVGYQPMVRDVLARWAKGEARNLVEAMQNMHSEVDVSAEPLIPERKIAVG